MLIHYDPDEYENVWHGSTCTFHKRYPGKPYAGCTCSAGYTQKRRAPEDVAKIKAEARRRNEDRILAEAEVIKARRGDKAEG